jgi:hypothetical protein
MRGRTSGVSSLAIAAEATLPSWCRETITNGESSDKEAADKVAAGREAKDPKISRRETLESTSFRPVLASISPIEVLELTGRRGGQRTSDGRPLRDNAGVRV